MHDHGRHDHAAAQPALPRAQGQVGLAEGRGQGLVEPAEGLEGVPAHGDHPGSHRGDGGGAQAYGVRGGVARQEERRPVLGDHHPGALHEPVRVEDERLGHGDVVGEGLEDPGQRRRRRVQRTAHQNDGLIVDARGTGVERGVRRGAGGQVEHAGPGQEGAEGPGQESGGSRRIDAHDHETHRGV